MIYLKGWIKGRWRGSLAKSHFPRLCFGVFSKGWGIIYHGVLMILVFHTKE